MIVSEKKKLQVNEKGNLQRMDITRTIRRPGTKQQNQIKYINQIPKQQNKSCSIIQAMTITLVIFVIFMLGFHYLGLQLKIERKSEGLIGRTQQLKQKLIIEIEFLV